MKKLLLTLTILTVTHSLHGMEAAVSEQVESTIDFSKLSPITLPQIYYYLSDALNKDVALCIFKLQPGTDMINRSVYILKNETPLTNKDKEKANPTIHQIANTYVYLEKIAGHCLTVEILKRNFLREKMLISDMRGHNEETLLHYMAEDKGTEKYAKILLEVDGNQALRLLTAQNDENQTALHIAAEKGNIEFVKLFLDAASNHVQDFINIPDKNGETTFDIAMPEVKELMQQYQNKNQ